MHENNVIHRDMKPKNVFVLGNGRVVLGDFGVSKCLDSAESLANTLIGSPTYMSPEIFEDKVQFHDDCVLETTYSKCIFH